MAQSCPNCHIPCTGCAGAKIVNASDGAVVCTKCLHSYEWNLQVKKKEGSINGDSDQSPVTQPSPNNEIQTYTITPVINSISSDYNPNK